MRARPRVLLACEMGGGLGHAGPLLRIADALRDAGADPLLALRNLPRVWNLVGRSGYPLLQAPMWMGSAPAGQNLRIGASFSDLLAMAGYDRVEHLQPLAHAWESLLDLVQPELVIADYSPTLCLVANQRVPTLNAGFGFIVPPTDRSTFPPLLAGRAALMPEADVLRVVQDVQNAAGREPPENLPALFGRTETFLTVLPQLDHYAAVRSTGHLGPPEPLLPPQSWPEAPRYFAYLKSTYPAAEAVLTALAQAGFPGSAFVLGAHADLRQRLRAAGVDVLDAAPALVDMLPTVSVVIHHGGINVAQQALAAGRAQLALPEHLEQILTAIRLQELGVGLCLKERYLVQEVPAAVRALLTDPAYRERTHARGSA